MSNSIYHSRKMTHKKYDISADDKALFRQEMGNVRKMNHDKVVPCTGKPIAEAIHTERDMQQVLRDMMSDELDPADFETGEELIFADNGVSPMVLRHLRRGKFFVQAVLDLHRMTSEQARDAVTNFIINSKASGFRCVRIIHGKGLGSFNKKPVLKGKLDYWLSRRQDVLAYCSARPMDGGTGAVYVLLRKS